MKLKMNLVKDLKNVKGKTLICGLPGIAYIGKLSIDYLIQQFHAELVGEIYSQYFAPYVLVNKDGLVELLQNELYSVPDGPADSVLFYTGNAQATSPEGQYYLVNEILDLAKQCGVQRIYAIAAFLTDKAFETPMKNGSISGMNGLIYGLAQIHQMEGACLLGETLGYKTATGQYLVDSKAVQAVLDVLTTILGVSVDMAPLQEQIKEMDALISRMTAIERQVMEEMRRVSGRDPSRYIT
jgi:proteasome assembly chaperone (PAC2) family protein